MQPCGVSVPSFHSKLWITLSGSWVRIPHKAAPEMVCVSCIIGNFAWEKVRYEYLTRLYLIQCVCVSCFISNFEWELGTAIPQGSTWDSSLLAVTWDNLYVDVLFRVVFPLKQSVGYYSMCLTDDCCWLAVGLIPVEDTCNCIAVV